MKIYAIAALAISIPALLTPSPVDADDIFSNFGANDTFDSGFIVSITGSDFVEAIVGVPIITGATAYKFDSAQLALFADSFGSYGINVQIRSDQGGVPSNTILASTTITEAEPGESGIVNWQSTANLRLRPNSTYWLVGTPVESNTYRGWHINNTDNLGYAYKIGSQGWIVDSFGSAPVCRVTGTPVPEPTSAIAVLFCLGFVGRLRHR